VLLLYPRFIPLQMKHMPHLALGSMGCVRCFKKGDRLWSLEAGAPHDDFKLIITWPGGRYSHLWLGGGCPRHWGSSGRGAVKASLGVEMLASHPTLAAETWGPLSSGVPWAPDPWEEASCSGLTP
jgi:hypothetical protein